MHQFQPTLYASLRSPFARRIRLTLQRLGISYIEKMVDVFQENPELISANPLGLVPTLITKAGPISDSQHILEYLHELKGGVWNSNPEIRTQERQASVWAAGVMQNSVLYFQESKLHEVPSERWLNDYRESIHQTLIHLSTLPLTIWFKDHHPLSQAGWDLCVALEYLSLRVPEIDWKKTCPQFLEIMDQALLNPDFKKTTPPA